MSISQNFPVVAPTLKLNFAKTKQLDPRITFTRSGSGTYIDNAGILRTAVANQPRFDHTYNSTTNRWESKGLLVEPSRTNFVPYSDNLAAAGRWNEWLYNDYLFDGPFGGPFLRTTKIISAPQYWPLGIDYSGANQPRYTPMVFTCYVRSHDASLTTFSISNVDVEGATYPISTSWTKITYYFTYSAQFVGATSLRIYRGSYNPVGASFDIANAQVEVGNFPTSYIPTPAIFISRASSATYYDSTGILRTAAINEARSNAYLPDSTGVFRSTGLLLEGTGTNLLYYSQDFDRSSWWGTAGVFVQKTVETAAPDGTYTAEFLQEDASTGVHSLSTTNNVYTITTQYYTHSVYVKTAGRTQIGIGYRDSGLTLFNLSTKQATIVSQIDSGSIVSNKIESLPNGWFRLSSTILGNGNSYNRRAQIFLCDGGSSSYTGNGTSGAYIWGYQVEQNSFATSYIPTLAGFSSRASSATYYDSTGILRTAAINEARSNAYLPDSNGVMRPAGLLLESETTNLLLYSQQFDDAYWSKSNVSVVANAITAPDGTLTADKLVENNTNSLHELFRGSEGSLSIGTDSFITISLYVKAAERNYCYIRSAGNSKRIAIVVDLTNGTFNYSNWASTKNNNATVEKLPNGWYRITATSQSDYPIAPGWAGNYVISPLDSYQLAGNVGGAGYSYQGNGTSGIYIWGAQYELLASAPSSYIPTTTASVTRSQDIPVTQATATRAADVSTSSAVTRAADSATITGSNFNSFYNPTESTLLSVGGENSNRLTSSTLTLNSDSSTSNTISNLFYYPKVIQYATLNSINAYPAIVTDGLVLNLDAGNRKSYPGAGTVWTDLSGNGNTGTLTNGPTYSSSNGGSIVFDGANDYIQTQYTTQLNDFTICSWFKNNSSSGYARIADKNFDTGFWFGSINSPTLWGGGVKQTNNYNSITLSTNQWHFLVMVRTGTSLKVYGDGITNTNTTVCGSGFIDTTALSLGATINDGDGQRDWFTGNIAQISIYNRALTATEVQQNFNATRRRYGI
jgi:hypothetical protein